MTNKVSFDLLFISMCRDNKSPILSKRVLLTIICYCFYVTDCFIILFYEEFYWYYHIFILLWIYSLYWVYQENSWRTRNIVLIDLCFQQEIQDLCRCTISSILKKSSIRNWHSYWKKFQNLIEAFSWCLIMIMSCRLNRMYFRMLWVKSLRNMRKWCEWPCGSHKLYKMVV